jgi:pilus assembly protein CpaE
VNVVIVVVDFTLAATRDAIRVLSWLKANAGDARVIVVANKVMPSLQEVSRKDFEHSIERQIDVVLPFDPKASMQAAKLGQPLAKSTKATKLTQPLMQILNLTLEHASREDDGAADGKSGTKNGGSLLNKFNFKALVAKKPKEASAKAA